MKEKKNCHISHTHTHSHCKSHQTNFISLVFFDCRYYHHHYRNAHNFKRTGTHLLSSLPQKSHTSFDLMKCIILKMFSVKINANYAIIDSLSQKHSILSSIHALSFHSVCLFGVSTQRYTIQPNMDEENDSNSDLMSNVRGKAEKARIRNRLNNEFVNDKNEKQMKWKQKIYAIEKCRETFLSKTFISLMQKAKNLHSTMCHGQSLGNSLFRLRSEQNKIGVDQTCLLFILVNHAIYLQIKSNYLNHFRWTSAHYFCLNVDDEWFWVFEFGLKLNKCLNCFIDAI